jgi:hypothetical protein
MTARWYAAAVVLAVGAAFLVLWQLATSDSTACFHSSVELAAKGSGELEGCDAQAAHAVRNHLAQHNAAEAAGEPSEVEARSALVVWMALFAATAGVAAVSAVRSVDMIAEVRPAWSRRLVGLSVGAAILVLLPFAVFRVLTELAPTELGPFDRLHLSEIRWLNPIIALLTLPAVVGLVSVGHVVSTRSGLGLAELASLGSRLRALVGMLAAILALGVLTTAARWEAIATLPGGNSVPSTVVLLWGSVFALVLALLYVPVHQLWATETERQIAEEVRRQLLDQASFAGTAGFRAPELALRKELHATLGVGGALHSLQRSLAVLAPVIAAAVSSLFA